MAPAEAPQAKRMTVEEFFDSKDEGHVGKLQLVDGVIRAQSFASDAHGTIQANLSALIWNHLREKRPDCRVGTEVGVIPRFDPKHNVRKPDLSVTCTSHKRGQRAFPDPILIVEIMSPTNQDDTWESIRACATIPTVIEILVVDSETRHAQVFTRDEQGNWPEPGVTVEDDGKLQLTSIDAVLPLADVYMSTDTQGKTPS